MSTERNYSLARALQSLVNNTVEASIEREESARMMSELGLHSRDNSIMVRSGFDGTSGAGLIGQEHRGDQFVEILRTRMGVKGARVLAGLTGVGTVDIPTQTGVTTIGIGAVGGTSADQNPNVGSVTLTPKKFSAAVTVSEELLAEGNPDAIAIVMNDLEAQIARKLDVTILKGNADPEIKGIDGTTGVQTHLITSFDNIAWSDVTAMYGKIADYEIEEGDLAWIGKGSTKALLMGKSRDVGSGRFLLEDGQMLGYGFNVCGALAADELYLGAWKNVIIGQWGGLQLKVDDITGIKSGSVTIVGKLLADVAIVNAAAFVKRVASQAS